MFLDHNKLFYRSAFDENHDAAIFEKTRKKLLEKLSNSEWNVNDKKNSLQAVDILQNNLDKFFKPFNKFQSLADVAYLKS